MKIKIMLEQLLSEGASDIMYHFTSNAGAVNILQTDEFFLTPIVGSKRDAEINDGKFYYLSTTRSRSSGFNLGRCLLVLDGRKLKQNHKFKPVNYFSSYNGNKNSEQEDRIISDKPTVKNASKYILEIHVLLNNVDTSNNGIDQVVLNLRDLCKEKNIKFYAYSDSASFRGKRDSVKDIDNLTPIDRSGFGRPPSINFPFFIATLLAFKNYDLYEKILDFIQDQHTALKFDLEIGENIKKYFTPNSPEYENLVKITQNAVENIRTNSSRENRFILTLLVEDMKKYGVRDIKDYVYKKTGSI
jgi:hypothetical protein